MATLISNRKKLSIEVQRDIIISKSKFFQEDGTQIYSTSDLIKARTNLLRNGQTRYANRLILVLQKLETSSDGNVNNHISSPKI